MAGRVPAILILSSCSDVRRRIDPAHFSSAERTMVMRVSEVDDGSLDRAGNDGVASRVDNSAFTTLRNASFTTAVKR